MVRMGRATLEEPTLNRSQRCAAGDDALFRVERSSLGCNLSQFGNRLPLEKLLDGQSQSRAIHPTDDLNTENRIAAKLKEVIINPYAIDAKNLLPDVSQQLLGWRPGRGVAGEQVANLDSGQGMAINFSICSQGQFIYKLV